MLTENKIAIHFIVLVVFILLCNASYDRGMIYRSENAPFSSFSMGQIVAYERTGEEILLTLDTDQRDDVVDYEYVKITSLTIFESKEYMNKMFDGDVISDVVTINIDRIRSEMIHEGISVELHTYFENHKWSY